jgi:uncharacterized protein (DUF433 family)
VQKNERMSYINRITINPDIMLGKPVIKGTRIGVELILQKLAEGATIEEVRTIYPSLELQDIYAALHYASKLIANEEIIVPKQAS